MNIGDLIPIGGARFTASVFPSGSSNCVIHDKKIKADSLVLVNPTPVGYEKLEVLQEVTNSNTFLFRSDVEITNNDKVFANTVIDGLKEVGITNVNVDVQSFDRTTPTTVINQAYSTEGNGGRKLVRLDNGTLFCLTEGGGFLRLYRSDNQGNNWSFVATVNAFQMTIRGFGLVSVDNMTYAYYSYASANVAIRPINLDGTLGNGQTIEVSQTDMGQCSMVASPLGTELHACWSSKNSTYPNSFNIRYAKGTINADGSVTWGSVEQVTNWSASTQNGYSPSIVLKNNNPIIVISFIATSSNSLIIGYEKSSGSWTQRNVYNADGNYTQANPSACTDKDGVIHVTWHGTDSAQNLVNQVRYSKSADGGITWSAMEKLTTGTKSKESANISANLNGEIFIVFHGVDDVFATTRNLHIIKKSNDVWQTIQRLTDGTTNPIQFPNIIGNLQDYIEPPLVYTDAVAGSVRFHGKWQELMKTLTLSENVNQSNGDKLDISTKSFPSASAKQGTWSVESEVGLNQLEVTGNVSNSNIVPYKNEIQLTTNDRVFANTVASGLKEVGINSVDVNTITIDRTTPITVINQAYNTQGNGGRKLVRLENGWLIAILYRDVTYTLYIMISKDGGNTWFELAYISRLRRGSSTPYYGASITSDGEYIYIFTLTSLVSNTPIYAYIKIDPQTQQNVDLVDLMTEISRDVNNYEKGSTSIVVSSDSSAVHLTWSEKDATYFNSFNIKYCKGTISADGSEVWGMVNQATDFNLSGLNCITPTIDILPTGVPFIVYRYYHNDGYWYIKFVRQHTDGKFYYGHYKDINIGNITYDQSSPSACVDKDGTIHVTWHGGDNITVATNIRYSKSTDEGTTWSAMEKLTSRTVPQSFPTITTDLSNNVYILWGGRTDDGYFKLKKISNIDGIWGVEEVLADPPTNHANHPSTCINYSNFTEPLTIWNNGALGVEFYGKWQEESHALVLSENVNQSIDDKLDISTKPVNRFTITSDTVETSNVPFGYALIKGVE